MRDTRAGITDVNDEVFADEYVGVAGRDIVVSFSSVMMMREVNVYGQHSKKLFLYFIDSHVCPLIASVATLATSIADRWHNAHSFHRPKQADYGVVFNLTYVVRLNPRTTTTTSPGQQLRSGSYGAPFGTGLWALTCICTMGLGLQHQKNPSRV